MNLALMQAQKNLGYSMDDQGNYYDSEGNQISNPNINPEWAGMATPIAELKIENKLYAIVCTVISFQQSGLTIRMNLHS